MRILNLNKEVTSSVNILKTLKKDRYESYTESLETKEPKR